MKRKHKKKRKKQLGHMEQSHTDGRTDVMQYRTIWSYGWLVSCIIAIAYVVGMNVSVYSYMYVCEEWFFFHVYWFWKYYTYMIHTWMQAKYIFVTLKVITLKVMFFLFTHFMYNIRFIYIFFSFVVSRATICVTQKVLYFCLI